jgi:L-ascorbate metabolism protein UlaG (beta-lactamase superfamily)
MRLILALCAALSLQASDKIATSKGDLEILPIEHATFVMKWDKTTILVDPVGGAERLKEFGKPDLILVTDIHGDHLDPKTVSGAKGEKTMVVAPQACAEKLGEGVTVLANGAKTKCGEVEIEAIPMYNLTAERKNFHTKGRGNGYVVTIGGKRIYISGDTEDIPEMRSLKGIDAAFVCMNLPYTMDVEHAAEAVLAFKPKVIYPYHYRGKDQVSDVEKFKSLVSKDKTIEVRLLKWYAK